MPIACVLCLHLFGNVVNTLGDHASGLDTKASSDDRALVDALVNIRDLRLLAALLLVAGCILAHHSLVLVASAARIVTVLGPLLAASYTMGPSLKHFGLGDAVVFMCFGPLVRDMRACRVFARQHMHCLPLPATLTPTHAHARTYTRTRTRTNSHTRTHTRHS